MVKTDIKSLNLLELENLIKEMGEPKFRASQIFKWLQSGVESFDEMTDISLKLREKLKENCYIASLKILRRLVSRLDGTVKYLYELNDGETIESVLMKYEHGYSLCISTQVGCRMGCSFCATGLGGLVRDLTASEMLSQITTAQKDQNIRISNVVMMGMGEPLDNFQNSVRFLELVSHPKGLNIGLRHISLSTSGVVTGIANELARRLKGIMCHINLIPVNPVKENSNKSPNKKQIQKFKEWLTDLGLNATVRRTLGGDINASCGQLRRREGGESRDS